MLRDYALLATVVTVLTAAPAVAGAEPPRRLEGGIFLGVDRFGDDIELGNSWAGEQIPGTSFLLGARFGLIFLPDLAPGAGVDPAIGVELEGKAALASTGELAENGRDSYFSPVYGWRAQVIGRLGLSGAFAPHLVVGLGGETVVTGSPFMVDDTDAAFHWGPGVSWHLGRTFDVRLDLRHGLTAGRTSNVVSTFEAQLGIVRAIEWGDRPAVAPRPRAKDSDGDGFLDPDDKCPRDKETENDFQDDDGCPDVADRDGDTILDPDDACVDEPENVNGIDDTDGCPELDTDGDGLIGPHDTCPDNAEDFDKFQDQDGCPDPDNDGDTRPDVSDACPDQPETYNGFDDDDGCPDEDNDQDGVVDEADRCVSEPGVRENAGCPDTDRDGDTVVDRSDNCPDEPGTPRFFGCKEKQLVIVTADSIELLDIVYFKTKKATIDKRSFKLLTNVANVVKARPELTRITVEGHTDDQGDDAYNKDLSQRRAQAVADFLIGKGVAPDKLEPIGYGEEKPLQPNTTKKGRAKNRRVEFKLQ